MLYLFPTLTAPSPNTRPRSEPLRISSINFMALASSPQVMSPASAATPSAPPISIESRPRSLTCQFKRPMLSSESISRFVPINPIVSYSSGETMILPSSPPNTFEHLIVQPAMQACDRSEEHTSELQSRLHLVCRLLLE